MATSSVRGSQVGAEFPLSSLVREGSSRKGLHFAFTAFQKYFEDFIRNIYDYLYLSIFIIFIILLLK